MLFTAALATVYKKYHINPYQILLLNNLLFPLDLKNQVENMHSPSEISKNQVHPLNLALLPNKNSTHIWCRTYIYFFFPFCWALWDNLKLSTYAFARSRINTDSHVFQESLLLLPSTKAPIDKLMNSVNAALKREKNYLYSQFCVKSFLTAKRSETTSPGKTN